MDSLKIVRLWAAAAWADGTMHPAEAAALQRLIDASDELSPTDREEALTYLTTSVTVEATDLQSLPAEAREGVYRAARGIVVLDNELVAAETSFLKRLRASLDLDEATIAKLDAE